MKVAVVNSDSGFLEKIQKIINSFFTRKKVEIRTVTFTNSSSLLNELAESRNYDLYLLDVEMPGINGIKLAEKIRNMEKEACIIFISGREEYAILGYKVQAYQYILKKEYQQELPIVLERIWQEKLDVNQDSTKKQYVIRNSNRCDRFLLDNVLYLGKEKKYTYFHCIGGITYKERDSLEAISERLPGDQFVFINRGCIVNLKYICNLEGIYIKLFDSCGGEKLQVSRRMTAEIREKLIQYIEKNKG